MPRTGGALNFFTFVAGLNTDASPLAFPENFSLDEENFELLKNGSRRRRLGIDYENNHSKITGIPTADAQDGATSVFKWENVDKDPDLSLLVIQIGPTLYFHDLTGAGNSVTNNKLAGTVNLSTYKKPTASSVGGTPVEMSAGAGKLFVVSNLIEPLTIAYDADADTFTVTELDLKVRDLTGVDDSLEVDERPTTLSQEHQYNLLNQGWSQDDIDETKSDQKFYPSNADIWYVTKDNNDNYRANFLERQGFGTSPAPKGRFVYSAFLDDRDTASGIGIDTEPLESRPSSVTFFGGRVFYAINDTIYFSQLIEEDGDFEKCYQEADPSAEHIFELVETDGGTIPIPESGNILKIKAFQDYILIVSKHGTWQLKGIDGKFDATNFQVNKVADVGTPSRKGLVDVEGTPFMIREDGLYQFSTADSTSLSGVLRAQSVTKDILSTLFDGISPESIKQSQLVYDEASKSLFMLYNSDPDFTGLTFKSKYDTLLILNLDLPAFYKYTISELATDSPFIVGAYVSEGQANTDETFDVVSNSGADNVQSNSGADEVVATVEGITASDVQLQMVCLIPETSDYSYGIAEFNNGDFVDWEEEDGTGVDFTSFIDTGYTLAGDAMRYKQALYVLTYMERTETSFVDNGLGGAEFDNPSSLNMRVKWDWANTSTPGRWSQQQQVYRLRAPFIAGNIGNQFDYGYDVVVAKTKVRGKGRALVLNFESESGKDARLLGWAIAMSANQNI